MTVHKITYREAHPINDPPSPGLLHNKYEVRCDKCQASGGEFGFQPNIGALAHLLRAGWGLEGLAGTVKTVLCPACMKAKAKERKR